MKLKQLAFLSISAPVGLMIVLLAGCKITTFYQGDFGGMSAIEKTATIQRVATIVLGDATAGEVAEIKAFNKKVKVLLYSKTATIHDYYPHYQAAADMGLLWLDDDGNRIEEISYPGCYLVKNHDPRWRQLLLDTLANYLDPFDGVMFDNLPVSSVSQFSAVPPGYDEAVFYQAQSDLLNYFKARFSGKYLHINGWKGFGAYDGIELLESYGDSISFEWFAYSNSGVYRGSDRVLKSLLAFRNRPAAMIDFIPSSDSYQQRMFTYCNYLLVQNTASAFSFILSNGAQTVFWPEYEYDPGKPTGEAYQHSNGLLLREYEKVTVASNINPSPITVTIGTGKSRIVFSGGGSFENKGSFLKQSISGSTLIIPPESGVLLVK